MADESPMAEQLTRIETRLDSVDGRLDTMDDHFDRVDVRLDRIDGRLDKVDGRLDRVEVRLDALATDVSVLKTDVSVLKTDVSGLKTDVSGLRQDLRASDHRTNVRFDHVDENIRRVAESFTTLHEHIDRQNAEMERRHNDRMRLLEAALMDHSTRIRRLEQTSPRQR